MDQENIPPTKDVASLRNRIWFLMKWFASSDFWKGFFGWFIVSTLLFNVTILIFNLFLLQIGPGATIVRASVLLKIQIPVNIIALIILYKFRPIIGHGAVFALIINLAILFEISTRTRTGIFQVPLPFYIFFDYLTIGDPFHYFFPF